MTLNQINEFVILAQTRSYHRAAEILYISQSSLSKHIMSLEAELGKPLFERTHRRVELSLFGASFLPYATQIATIERDFSRMLADTPHEQESITLGVSLTIGTDIFADLAAEVMRYHPGSYVKFQTGNSETLHNSILSGGCDIIVDTMRITSDDVVSKFITNCHLAAVLPRVNSLSQYSVISTSMLAGLPYIHLGESYKFDGGLGVPLICVNDVGIAIDLVSKNCGYTILNKLVASRITNDAVAVVELERSPLFDVKAFCLKSSLEKSIVRDVFSKI